MLIDLRMNFHMFNFGSSDKKMLQVQVSHSDDVYCISQYASNMQGREEGKIEVKDGQSYEVPGQIGKWQPDLNRICDKK